MDPIMVSEFNSLFERLHESLELFEMILACLPMKDLLFAQLVCRRWKSVITSSPILQETLFFKPGSFRSSSAVSLVQSTELLKTHAIADIGKKLTGNDFRRNILLETKFNPLFSKPINAYQMFTSEDLLSMEWNKDDQSRIAYARQDASWRNMLLFQPASEITQLQILYKSQGQVCTQLTISEKNVDPKASDELRLGWVYDRCCDQAFQDRGSFALRWHMLKSEKLWKPMLTLSLFRPVLCRYPPKPSTWKAMWSKGYVSKDFNDFRHNKDALQAPETVSGFRVRSGSSKRILLDNEDVMAKQDSSLT